MFSRISAFLISGALATASLADVLPSSATTDPETSTMVPLADQVFIPCAVGGIGEVVDFTGTLHMVSVVTIDENGGFHLQIHTQPVNVLGVGMLTGDTYIMSGSTVNTINAGSGIPIETTFVSNLNLIGPGPDNNLRVQVRFQLTITPDFQQTARFLEMTADCN